MLRFATISEALVKWVVDELGGADTIPSQDPGISIRPMAAGGVATPELTVLRIKERDGKDDGDAEIVLGAELGRGGMGAVRTAWQVPLGREVAVKLLLPSAHVKARQALIDEATIAGALEHPNIPPVHFLGSTADGRPVLLMKRIDGAPWSAMLGDPDHSRWRSVVGSRLDWNLGVLMQVANAVHFAHTHGYVHRDLKPENVMIGDFGEVYVLDWGIAARIDALAAVRAETNRAELVGTPAFVAPEMLDASVGSVGRRTDVYLLGGVLHQILTGRPPNDGASLMAALIDALDPKPLLVPDNTPAALTAIVRRALARDPNDRYESAESLRGALLEFLYTRDSARIVVRASKGLERLKDLVLDETSDRVEVYRVFGECRLGFEEALRIQPTLSVASIGLRDALLAMTDLELARGNTDGAELLLAEAADAKIEDATRVRLAKAIEAQRSKNAARDDEHRRLQSMEADMDVTRGSRTRAYVTLALMAAFVLGSQPVIMYFDRPEIAARVGLVIALIIAGAIMRKTLLANAATRKLSFAVLALAAVAPMHLVLQTMIGYEHGELLSVDLLFLSSGLSLIAITVDPRTGWSAAIALVGAFASARYQIRAFEIVGLTLILVAGIQVLIWGRSARRARLDREKRRA